MLSKDASDSDESSDVPQWFIDWFYVLYTEQRAVWQVRATVCPLAPPPARAHPNTTQKQREAISTR